MAAAAGAGSGIAKEVVYAKSQVQTQLQAQEHDIFKTTEINQLMLAFIGPKSTFCDALFNVIIRPATGFWNSRFVKPANDHTLVPADFNAGEEIIRGEANGLDVIAIKFRIMARNELMEIALQITQVRTEQNGQEVIHHFNTNVAFAYKGHTIVASPRAEIYSEKDIANIRRRFASIRDDHIFNESLGPKEDIVMIYEGDKRRHALAPTSQMLKALGEKDGFSHTEYVGQPIPKATSPEEAAALAKLEAEKD